MTHFIEKKDSKNKKIFRILGFFSVSCLSFTCFEQSMESEYSNSKANKLCHFVKKLFETNHFEIAPEAHKRIPKKLHQIWIGGPLPKKFQGLIETWKKKHPDWEYKLWTDQDLENFKFTMCRKAFNQVASIGAKADILRYEILYQFGGVYVDIDFECIRPLDVLVNAHSFFTSLGDQTYIANSVIGVIPGHPAIKDLLDKLKGIKANQLNNPWYQTGPFLLTRSLCRSLKKSPKNYMIYPTRYFHPLPNSYRFDYRKGVLLDSQIRSFCIPETFAIHYWAESWR